MKTIHFAYSKVPNMGDLLNELVMDRLFHVPYVHETSVFRYELTGIGSFLQNIFAGTETNFKGKIKRIIYQHCPYPCYVWGTGFLQDYTNIKTRISRNDVVFMAVRGRLTQKSVENIIGQQINPVLGDGGIITPMFVKKCETKYKIGLIPHFREIDCENVSYIVEKYPDCHIIDLRKDPISVIEEISSCETVLSSSLHGLILSDAYRIPNMRIKLTDAPRGGDFKFSDYYSAYNLAISATSINSTEDVPDINTIIDKYLITDGMVNTMQHGMFKTIEEYINNR